MEVEIDFLKNFVKFSQSKEVSIQLEFINSVSINTSSSFKKKQSMNFLQKKQQELNVLFLINKFRKAQ